VPDLSSKTRILIIVAAGDRAAEGCVMAEKPNEKLALRIKLFRETGQVRADVADFVERELEGLARAGLPVSEETAGMLTSHLMMALNRLQNGEALEEASTDEHITAELADHPRAVGMAQQIAVRAGRALGAALLPDSEINYLAMHLAVLAGRSPAVSAPAAGQQNGEQP